MRASDFENELSTEQIRNRMIKNAAKVWGVEIEDIESTFDPLVTMLIEACSYELNKINREMMSSRTRIMNRLAQTLSPETLIGAQPAHTIIQARSIEMECTINRDDQFSTVIKQHSVDVDKKEITKEIYFSPLKNYKLFDAQIKYSISGNKVYEYKNGVIKQSIAEDVRSSLNSHTLWLGLDINTKIQQLDEFVFFLIGKTILTNKNTCAYCHLLNGRSDPTNFILFKAYINLLRHLGSQIVLMMNII
ncbi:MAG: type VI secretion system baseplate subunit TssF [Bacteroidetes bacterium]|nr:type VI secretion system baseplate subunit TssF [Bacteroidota bacterium]